MIGHFLLALSPCEEDRVLTQPMREEGRYSPGEVGCLVQVAWARDDVFYEQHVMLQPNCLRADPDRWVPGRYDELCERFGRARVNAAIRTRILANRAARALRAQAVAV